MRLRGRRKRRHRVLVLHCGQLVNHIADTVRRVHRCLLYDESMDIYGRVDENEAEKSRPDSFSSRARARTTPQVSTKIRFWFFCVSNYKILNPNNRMKMATKAFRNFWPFDLYSLQSGFHANPQENVTTQQLNEIFQQFNGTTQQFNGIFQQFNGIFQRFNGIFQRSQWNINAKAFQNSTEYWLSLDESFH
jgi:hypothetical protein